MNLKVSTDKHQTSEAVVRMEQGKTALIRGELSRARQHFSSAIEELESAAMDVRLKCLVYICYLDFFERNFEMLSENIRTTKLIASNLGSRQLLFHPYIIEFLFHLTAEDFTNAENVAETILKLTKGKVLQLGDYHYAFLYEITAMLFSSRGDSDIAIHFLLR